MSLSTIVNRKLPDVETDTDLDLERLLSAFKQHSWIAGFGLLEFGLLAVSFILDLLAGKTVEDPKTLHVVAGLLGAYAVLMAIAGGLVIIVWGGYSLLQSPDEYENPY